MKQISRSGAASIGLGLLAVISLGLLSGCASSRSTGSKEIASKQVQLTGSHIPTPGNSAKGASSTSSSALTVYSREDIERSGASDLAAFLRRVPYARVHP